MPNGAQVLRFALSPFVPTKVGRWNGGLVQLAACLFGKRHSGSVVVKSARLSPATNLRRPVPSCTTAQLPIAPTLAASCLRLSLLSVPSQDSAQLLLSQCYPPTRHLLLLADGASPPFLNLRLAATQLRLKGISRAATFCPLDGWLLLRRSRRCRPMGRGASIARDSYDLLASTGSRALESFRSDALFDLCSNSDGREERRAELASGHSMHQCSAEPSALVASLPAIPRRFCSQAWVCRALISSLSRQVSRTLLVEIKPGPTVQSHVDRHHLAEVGYLAAPSLA